MTSVVSQFKAVSLGTSRDECIDALDRVGLLLLDQIGGAPWQVPDDDIKKVPASQVTVGGVLADSDGFCYIGIRTYDFRGPIVLVPSQPQHDGFKVQSANE